MADKSVYRTELAPVQAWDQGDVRINGPAVIGVGVGNPVMYAVPVCGKRPIEFSAVGLPPGLTIDSKTGIISGRIEKKGKSVAVITASNAAGSFAKKIKITAGTICLTPPMGWNSWNCWGSKIDDAKIRAAAASLVSSGLAAHGYSYVNIDDAWQGRRGGAYNALMPNERFPDMVGLSNYVHSLGLKLGIYSTPWATSYAGYAGGSSGDPIRYHEGWMVALNKAKGWGFGKYSHHAEDARQWAEWGIDYLKYDWNPWEVAEVEAMSQALKACGRDIVYSLSNSAPFVKAADWAKLANCWRTTGDIFDNWDSVSGIAFSQDRWTPFGGPGHWNDPDMLVIGKLGWGNLHDTNLTRDEQVTHMTMWALLAAPLLIGCDLTQIDDLTMRLLCNDEMIAINQDSLGSQGRSLRNQRNNDILGNEEKNQSVYVRELNDGSLAVGLFNRADFDDVVKVTWKQLDISGERVVRDVWAKKDLGKFKKKLAVGVPAHGAQLLKIMKD